MARANICSLSPELIARIATYLGYDHHRRVEHDQLSFALTCRFISQPALDALWQDLEDLVPLLYTLPRDLVALAPPAIEGPNCRCRRLHDIACINTKYRHFTILRAPRAGDFDRFSVHARRVKELKISRSRSTSLMDLTTYDLTQEIWEFLQAHAPKPLLPNLKKVDYDEPLRTQDCSPRPVSRLTCGLDARLRACELPLEPFVGPRLKHAEISMRKEGSSTPDSLRLLASNSTQLTTLILVGRQILEGSELGAFVNLTRFSCLHGSMSIEISPEALRCLGALPRLRELDIKVAEMDSPEDWHWDEMLLERPTGLFPSLEELEVTTRDLEWSIPFFKTITSPLLYSIILRHTSGPGTYLLCQQICECIGDLPSRDKVSYLSLTTPAPNPLEPDHKFLGPSTIAPLLRLPRLEYLEFYAKLPMIVDDTLLEQMSRAWPHIYVLKLPWPRSIDWSPRVGRYDQWLLPNRDHPGCPQASLPGLVPLVARCRNLIKLALAIDTRRRQRRIHEILECPPPELRSRFPSLCYFSIEGSVLGDSPSLLTIANFFSLVCPALGKGTMDCRVSVERWHRIWQHIDDFNAIREEELRWKEKARRRLAATAASGPESSKLSAVTNPE